MQIEDLKILVADLVIAQREKELENVQLRTIIKELSEKKSSEEPGVPGNKEG